MQIRKGTPEHRSLVTALAFTGFVSATLPDGPAAANEYKASPESPPGEGGISLP